MEMQQCNECKGECPVWMIVCLEEVRMCKICILSGQVEANRVKIEEIKMDIDVITGRINESNINSDDTNNIRSEIRMIKERVENIGREELDFSGFTKPDVTEVNKEQKIGNDREGKSGEGVENGDWKMLEKDVESMITSGMKEIRNTLGRQDKEENQVYSFFQNTGNCSNRYGLLGGENGEGEEGREYEILGNAEVRYMRERTKKGGKRGVYSTKGAGILDILKHIENKQIEGKTTVIHGGGDDIEKLETERMMKAYKEATEEIEIQGHLCIYWKLQGKGRI